MMYTNSNSLKASSYKSRRTSLIRRLATRVIGAALVSLGLIIPANADYLGTENLRIFLAPVTPIIDGYQNGDIIEFVIEVTPADTGSTAGHAAWSTLYIPTPSAEVIGARYLTPSGPFTTSAAEPVDAGYEGVGARGAMGYVAPLAEGFVNKVQQDTGLFYSTDSRTAQVILPALADVDPTGVNANQPFNTWDRDQVLAFGEGGALSGNGGQGNTPLVDIGGTLFGTGSAVAGADSYYTKDYDPDCNGGSAVFSDDVVCDGPWLRIETLGDQIGGSGAVVAAVADPGTIINSAVDATGGFAVSAANPLPAATNAVRIVHGARRLGDIERYAVTLRVTATGADVSEGGTGSFRDAIEGTGPNAATGPIICADSIPGDTSDTAAKDNNWRYYEVSRSCTEITNGVLFKEITSIGGDTTPPSGAQPGDVVEYQFTFTNTTGGTLNDIFARDPGGLNLNLQEPGAGGCPANYDGVVSSGGTVAYTALSITNDNEARWAEFDGLADGESIVYIVCGTVDGGANNGELVENESRIWYGTCTGSIDPDADPPCLTSKAIVPVTNRISGTKFNDLDGSGTETAGDGTFSGITIQLHEDTGSTAGVLDGTDTFLTGTVTDTNGNYSFAAIPDGDYIIVEVPDPTHTSTGDTDNPGGPCIGTPIATDNGCNTIGSVVFPGNPAPITVTDTTVLADQDFFNFIPAPNLGIVKTDSPDPASPGGALVYTLTVTNTGTIEAVAGVVVTDTLPTGVTFNAPAVIVGATGACVEAPTDTITCTLTSAIAVSGVVTITLNVTVDP